MTEPVGQSERRARFAMAEKVRLIGGWPTARLAHANRTPCWACGSSGELVVKERREGGVRSYGWYHRNCLPRRDGASGDAQTPSSAAVSATPEESQGSTGSVG